MNYWIGQGFGILATATDVTLPLYKKKWQMLVANIGVNAFQALNLIFLNQIGSGIFMFLVAAVQAVINLVHTLRETSVKKWEYAVFFVLYVGLGFYGLLTAPDFVPGINPQNLLELLPIIGAVFSMLFVCTRDEQKARVFLLICSILWTAYHAIILSTAFLGSFFGVITCIIAMIRDRKK